MTLGEPAKPERPRDPERARTAADRARKAERARKTERGRQADEGAPEREVRRDPPNVTRGVRVVTRWLRGAFIANYPVKFVALILALAVFILVQSDEDMEISVFATIAYPPVEERVLVSEPVEQVRLTVSGTRRTIQRFDERAIERVHLDLSDRQSGELYFTADMFDVPEDLRIVAITPPSTALHFESRDRKDVPIDVLTVGEPAPGHVVEQVSVLPKAVTVTGPKSVVAGVDSVQTREIALDGRTSSFEDTVPLMDLPRQLELAGDRFVRVEVEISKRAETRALGSRQVSLEPGAGVKTEDLAGFQLAPREAQLTLRGTSRALQPIDPDDISLIVEVGERDREHGPPRNVRIEARGLPEGVTAEIEPPQAALTPP